MSKNDFVQVQVCYELDVLLKCICRRSYLGTKVIDQKYIAAGLDYNDVKLLAEYLNQGNELRLSPEVVEWA